MLIDGHRVVNNSRSTDPSVIPTLGLERVEVVADGASAVYGSDAIAGVVNLVPRRSLDGVEAFVRAGIAGESSFHELALGAAVGKVFDRGQAMLAYEHVERSNLSGDDRDFFVSDQTPFGGRDYSSTRCSPGTIRANGTSYAIPAGGVTQATAGSLVAGTVNLCNDLTGQDLFPEQTYDLGQRHRHLRGDRLARGLRRRLLFEAHILPPRRLSSDHAHCARDERLLRAPRRVHRDQLPDRLQLPRRRPPGDTEGFAESWQITPGLRFSLPHDWEFEALVTHGETHDFSGAYTGLNNGALAAALASSDPSVAFDPYGLGRTAQPVLETIANQIFLAPTDGKLTAYEARANGALFAPAGRRGQACGRLRAAGVRRRPGLGARRADHADHVPQLRAHRRSRSMPSCWSRCSAPPTPCRASRSSRSTPRCATTSTATSARPPIRSSGSTGRRSRACACAAATARASARRPSPKSTATRTTCSCRTIRTLPAARRSRVSRCRARTSISIQRPRRHGRSAPISSRSTTSGSGRHTGTSTTKTRSSPTLACRPALIFESLAAGVAVGFATRIIALSASIAEVAIVLADDLDDADPAVQPIDRRRCAPLIGPGAYSIDARLFGRATITLPR